MSKEGFKGFDTHYDVEGQIEVSWVPFISTSHVDSRNGSDASNLPGGFIAKLITICIVFQFARLSGVKHFK